jgi:Cu-Zn family superoxide dismutase
VSFNSRNSNNFNTQFQNDEISLSSFMKRPPTAYASIRGSETFPSVKGTVRFYQMKKGVLVVAEIDGLPKSSSSCKSPVFAFHVHDGNSCENSPPPNLIEPRNTDQILPHKKPEPFPESGMHYNPNGCPHPYHAGDMPPLFSANGYAFITFVTPRFTVKEIIGKPVIIHSSPDDFTTQPSGNSGEKIACGIITAR